MGNPEFIPQSPPLTVVLPSQQEFLDFFRDFLQNWAQIPCQPIVGMGDEIPNLPLERSLLFSEPSSGILVVRTDPEFELYLQQLHKEGQPREHFLEMVVVFWHRFVSRFWSRDSRKIATTLMKKTIPMNWPDRRPNLFLPVLVDRFPMGLRLWTQLSRDEVEIWKKTRSSAGL